MTGGKLGAMPDWWPYFEAADECRSQPWIMAGLPQTAGMRCWLEWSLIRRSALADAKEELQRKAELNARMRSGRR